MKKSADEMNALATRLRLAAAAAGVRRVALVAVGKPIDLAPLGDLLALPATAEGTIGEEGGVLTLQVSPLGLITSLNGHSPRTGLVAVTPSRLNAVETAVIDDLVRISHWPLLGIVVYPNRVAPWRRRARLPMANASRPATASPRGRLFRRNATTAVAINQDSSWPVHAAGDRVSEA